MTDDEIWDTYADNIQHDVKVAYPEILDELIETFFGANLSPIVLSALSDHIYDGLETYSVPYLLAD